MWYVVYGNADDVVLQEHGPFETGSDELLAAHEWALQEWEVVAILPVRMRDALRVGMDTCPVCRIRGNCYCATNSGE